MASACTYLQKFFEFWTLPTPFICINVVLLVCKSGQFWLRECCKPTEAEVVSNSRNKICEIWPKSFSRALYTFRSHFRLGVALEGGERAVSDGGGGGGDDARRRGRLRPAPRQGAPQSEEEGRDGGGRGKVNENACWSSNKAVCAKKNNLTSYCSYQKCRAARLRLYEELSNKRGMTATAPHLPCI